MVRMDASTLRLDSIRELTIYQVEEVTKELLSYFATAEAVSVDLTQTDKIDSAGFQLLVSLEKSCSKTGKKFMINGICDSVENFMTLFGYVWDDEYKETK